MTVLYLLKWLVSSHWICYCHIPICVLLMLLLVFHASGLQKSACEVNIKCYTDVLATGISHYLLSQYTMLLYYSNLTNTKMKFKYYFEDECRFCEPSNIFDSCVIIE